MIYVVIPVYINSDHITHVYRSCISSYRKYVHDSTLICIDDHSPIQIPLQADIELSTPQNLGYTGCVNTGLKYVLEHATDQDYVFIVNDDVEFPDNWWMIKNSLTDDVGAVSALVSDEPVQPRNRIIDDMKFGSYWAMSVKTLKKIGLLDESMKAYFSDTDYFKRIKSAKLRVVKDTSVYIPHAGNQTYGSLDNNEEKYAEDALSYKEKHGRLD